VERRVAEDSELNVGEKMKITVDRTKCEGFAKCLQVTPKVFKLDAKMIAEVIDPKGDSDEKILFAAKLCPTKAISLEEEGTGKKLFPPD
jgi:ferredoxin